MIGQIFNKSYYRGGLAPSNLPSHHSLSMAPKSITKDKKGLVAIIALISIAVVCVATVIIVKKFREDKDKTFESDGTAGSQDRVYDVAHSEVGTTSSSNSVPEGLSNQNRQGGDLSISNKRLDTNNQEPLIKNANSLPDPLKAPESQKLLPKEVAKDKLEAEKKDVSKLNQTPELTPGSHSDGTKPVDPEKGKPQPDKCLESKENKAQEVSKLPENKDHKPQENAGNKDSKLPEGNKPTENKLLNDNKTPEPVPADKPKVCNQLDDEFVVVLADLFVKGTGDKATLVPLFLKAKQACLEETPGNTKLNYNRTFDEILESKYNEVWKRVSDPKTSLTEDERAQQLHFVVNAVRKINTGFKGNMTVEELTCQMFIALFETLLKDCTNGPEADGYWKRAKQACPVHYHEVEKASFAEYVKKQIEGKVEASMTPEDMHTIWSQIQFWRSFDPAAGYANVQSRADLEVELSAQALLKKCIDTIERGLECTDSARNDLNAALSRCKPPQLGDRALFDHFYEKYKKSMFTLNQDRNKIEECFENMEHCSKEILENELGVKKFSNLVNSPDHKFHKLVSTKILKGTAAATSSDKLSFLEYLDKGELRVFSFDKGTAEFIRMMIHGNDFDLLRRFFNYLFSNPQDRKEQSFFEALGKYMLARLSYIERSFDTQEELGKSFKLMEDEYKNVLSIEGEFGNKYKLLPKTAVKTVPLKCTLADTQLQEYLLAYLSNGKDRKLVEYAFNAAAYVCQSYGTITRMDYDGSQVSLATFYGRTFDEFESKLVATASTPLKGLKIAQKTDEKYTCAYGSILGLKTKINEYLRSAKN